MNQKPLDEDLVRKNGSDKFVQPEIENSLLSKNWHSIVKKLNGTVEGSSNPYLLDYNIQIKDQKLDLIKINLFKQLQSSSWSVWPIITPTYKNLTIEKEVKLSTKWIEIKKATFKHSVLNQLKSKKNKAIKVGVYFFQFKGEKLKVDNLLRIPIISESIQKNELLKFQFKAGLLLIQLNNILSTEEEIENFIDQFIDLESELNKIDK